MSPRLDRPADRRAVAVIAIEQGRLALCPGPDGPVLPIRDGSGEAACRAVLLAVLGTGEGQVRHIGTVAALEVWLARRLPRRLDSAERARFQWFSREEVVRLIASAGLRDSRSLAALALAGLADLLPEAPAGPEDRAPAPPERASAVYTATPSPDWFLNEDSSWLEFNARVLALAEDPATPLLERVRFLAIVSSNLDDLFRTRVAELRQAMAQGSGRPSADGLPPAEQLDHIADRVRALVARQYACFTELCLRELPAHGIRIRRWPELDARDRARLRHYFDEHVLPVLTPKAITRAPGHPFPAIVDLRISLAVVFHDPRTGRTHLAHLKVPDTLPRFARPSAGEDFVPIEDLIVAHVAELFPGRPVEAVHPFRITRSAVMQLDEQGSANLLQAMEAELERQPFGPVVRIEVERAMPRPIRDLLLSELRFEESDQAGLLGQPDLYELDGLVDLGALEEVAALERPELRYPPLTPAAPIPADRPVCAVLDERDVLVHHPYDGFDATTQRFLVEAADDPDVVAIKLTLYRAGGASAIVDALKRAAAAGKDVFVFVELKARFDERYNVFWAKRLMRAGIHVVTGLVRLKAHAKMALIVRRAPDGRLRRYAHIGTGNYNAETAGLYTDLGLLTGGEAVATEVNTLFNELTGSSQPPEAPFQVLLVAPATMRRRFLELIRHEAEHAAAGRPAHIRAKMNGLTDPEIIEALYRASQAGVRIELLVRGICTLRPGVPGLSETIRVAGAVGRFLEHARIYHFANGAEPEYCIGSADWRARNLRRRVEVLTPVRDSAARARLARILEVEWNDPRAWELQADGSYQRREAPPGARSAQEEFIQAARSAP